MILPHPSIQQQRLERRPRRHRSRRQSACCLQRAQYHAVTSSEQKTGGSSARRVRLGQERRGTWPAVGEAKNGCGGAGRRQCQQNQRPAPSATPACMSMDPALKILIRLWSDNVLMNLDPGHLPWSAIQRAIVCAASAGVRAAHRRSAHSGSTHSSRCPKTASKSALQAAALSSHPTCSLRSYQIRIREALCRKPTTGTSLLPNSQCVKIRKGSVPARKFWHLPQSIPHETSRSLIQLRRVYN